jgi:aspartyl protease family protein
MSMRDNRFMEPEKGEGVGILGWAVRMLVFWAIAGVVLYAVVANRNLVSPQNTPAKPMASLTAPAPPAASSNSLILRARKDGYVYVDAAVNGTTVKMAFDTGATLVSLSQADAQKIGVAGGLTYSMAFQTANGTSYGAPVTLREIRIGQLVIEDVQAVVMQNLSGGSLLGQSFLSRVESYQMRDGVMTLTW